MIISSPHHLRSGRQAERRQGKTPGEKFHASRDPKLLRPFLGGRSYYRNFVRDTARRIRPTTSLPKLFVNFVFVRKLLAELSTLSVLVYPDWDTVTETSRPYDLYVL